MKAHLLFRGATIFGHCSHQRHHLFFFNFPSSLFFIGFSLGLAWVCFPYKPDLHCESIMPIITKGSTLTGFIKDEAEKRVIWGRDSGHSKLLQPSFPTLSEVELHCKPYPMTLLLIQRTRISNPFSGFYISQQKLGSCHPCEVKVFISCPLVII